MENNSKKKLLLIPLLLAVFVAVVVIVSMNGKEWTCDWCGKEWNGEAYYYGENLNSTLCEECAIQYYNPLPIEDYKKEGNNLSNDESKDDFVSDCAPEDFNLNGNTSENFTNDALAAQQEDWIYYVNRSSIYKENTITDERTFVYTSEFDKIQRLAICGDYIYFFGGGHLCRVRTDGQNSRIMFDDDDGYSPAEYVIYNEKIYLPKREKISASKYSYCIVEFDIKTSTERKLFESKEMLEQIGVEKGYLVTRESQNKQKISVYELSTGKSSDIELDSNYSVYHLANGNVYCFESAHGWTGGECNLENIQVYDLETKNKIGEIKFSASVDAEGCNIVDDYLYMDLSGSDDYALGQVYLGDYKDTISTYKEINCDRTFNLTVVGEWTFDSWIYYRNGMSINEPTYRVKTDGTGFEELGELLNDGEMQTTDFIYGEEY